MRSISLNLSGSVGLPSLSVTLAIISASLLPYPIVCCLLGYKAVHILVLKPRSSKSLYNDISVCGVPKKTTRPTLGFIIASNSFTVSLSLSLINCV